MCTKVRIANFSLCWNVIYEGQIVEVMFGEDKLTGPGSQELLTLCFEGCNSFLTNTFSRHWKVQKRVK